VSNYFYCCIRPEGLVCDTERDVLAIAKLFVYAYLTHESLCALCCDCSNSTRTFTTCSQSVMLQKANRMYRDDVVF